MFTGIICCIGQLVSIVDHGNGEKKMTVSVLESFLSHVKIGSSVCCNGCCLTVTNICAKSSSSDCVFSVDLSSETLKRTSFSSLNDNKKAIERYINLEFPLTLQQPLDGHMIMGHVDEMGVVDSLTTVGNSWHLRIRASQNIASYVAKKGSVAINGVSLTINEVADSKAYVYFDVNIIPHTLQETCLRYLTAGDFINIEVDILSRYTVRALSLMNSLTKK